MGVASTTLGNGTAEFFSQLWAARILDNLFQTLFAVRMSLPQDGHPAQSSSKFQVAFPVGSHFGDSKAKQTKII